MAKRGRPTKKVVSKRGRPAKTTTKVVEVKKRGRPKKEVEAPKKRGRPAKVLTLVKTTKSKVEVKELYTDAELEKAQSFVNNNSRVIGDITYTMKQTPRSEWMKTTTIAINSSKYTLNTEALAKALDI